MHNPGTANHAGRSKTLSTTIIIALACLTVNTAHAGRSVPFVPGEYEMTAQGSTEVTKDCYKDPALNAAVLQSKMNAAFKGQEVCRISDSAKSAPAKNELDLKIACKYPDGMLGRGAMNVTVDGDAFVAVSSFELSVQGQSRKRQMTTKGRRIGGC